MKKNIANRPNFGIITNGTIITEKHLSFFKKYSFQITLSIDGPEHIHDYF